MLPNFICPGAARSATTSLYYLLIQHPQIYLPKIKETRFFAIDYDKGLPWYEARYYPDTANEIAVGDISPAYLIHEKCPERILESLGPSVKFIFMLRNPVDRAISHYKLLKRMQVEDLPLAEALEAKNRQEKSMAHFRHEYSLQYLKESTYTQHINRYLKLFPKENMKFILFEEFVNDVEKYLVEITEFLGVESGFKFNLDYYKNQNIASNHTVLNSVFYRNPISKRLRDLIQMNTSWKTQVFLKKLKNTLLSSRSGQTQAPAETDHELIARLNDYFTQEIEELSLLVNKDLSIWRTSKTS